MSADENKALVRRFVEKVQNQHDLDAMDELFYGVEDGILKDHWANFDQPGMLQQLGVIPTPE